LYRYVPKDLIERPKQGFSIPIDEWIRGPLMEWAEEMLRKENIEPYGYLNYELIHKKWEEHKKRKRNWGNQLWTVLMFQAWFKRNY
jgi:asparagine synthase (glutamine-hydrolysing)